MNGYYKIHQSDNDELYYFNLYAGNHEIILTSQGYTSKQSALGGIDSIRENSADNANYESSEASDGSMYFILKAANGLTIGKSQMYTSMDGCAGGIICVMKNAPTSTIKEESTNIIQE